MSETSTTERREPLAGARVANAAVSITAAPAASRISLRATEKGAEIFSNSLGFKLPSKPKKSASKAGKHALWLGPDEWLLINEKDENTSMVPNLSNPEFAAVEVSHRNVAVIVSGAGAENTLAAGCPQNLSLSAFPVGTCSRTIFGKAEVVLYRTDDNTFRVEFWRSFAPYVWGLLSDAAKDAAV